ncbi:nicotinate (nicotinamide) nucleotide adenylyltransferase [Sulfuricurvum sp.]|uniref:nicotinate (nicotinamide) nucleotide adenylyltransferase n=1 Tax=Sulfuricurvum sp. TaxID=2025608 RepID=UPI00261196F7|nr:nicotinate (nicotinamide) nucleotide adenylyltransferase [Sulfuricurvum sp.]MDD2265566.1 nicotinate (nicotinamide) nucleotide adenylyltransferase [Sulfuricurvum sp.]MDD2783822.1 nicotinate (nicotinamide) nucleotide adenylyltransferase [Sulfuricurvum sp.]
MKLALYGGSFDPPHAGHVRIVNEALKILPVNRLVIVPASRNPFKATVRASSAVRYKWLKSIFAAYPNVEISDFEIQQNRSVPTIETVKHYATLYDEIYLIIGADNLEKLHEWHRFEELNRMVHWVVASRGNIPIPKNMISLNVKEEISSTDFRSSFSSLGLEPNIENDIITYYKELNESEN